MNKKEFIAINANEATKTDLLTALEGLPKSVQDENLLDRVKYTLTQAKKSIKKVTVADLKDLVTEAQAMLAPAPAPVEAAKKPVKKATSKKAEPVEDDEEDEDTEKKPEKSKKSLKKSGVKTAPQRSPKASNLLPVASMFPEELSFEADDGEKTLTRVHDKYHTMQEVRDAINDGKTLFIAAYWTKMHLKKYGYAEMFHLTDTPKPFPDDLDILNIVVACDTMDRVFAMSTYTEAMYRFDKPDFEPVEDEDPSDGEKFTVRVSNGMEFEVYEIDE